METETGTFFQARKRTYIKFGWRIALVLVMLFVVILPSNEFDRPPRRFYHAELFPGVVYTREALTIPRPLVIHTVEIDLTVPRLGFLVTPGEASQAPARTTSSFLQEFNAHLAINGSFFEPFQARTPWDYYPRVGDWVNVKGQAISDGRQYADADPEWPVLCIHQGYALIDSYSCPVETLQALAGNHLLVSDGSIILGDSHDHALHPRTAVAVDADGARLWLIIVDGRQRNYSEGMTLPELAEHVVSLGIDAALNLDGGGSSTLVIAGHRGPHILNAPIHTNVPMRQRPVANHLGLYILPDEEVSQ